jgi:hypothetical protein
MGARDTKTYGVIGMPHKLSRTHRVVWELINGPIPPGLNVLHYCDNPPCVNPSHLFLGTKSDNTQDCLRKGRFIIGEQSCKHKLTLTQVKEILASTLSQQKLADKFGVSRRTIGHVRHKDTWIEALKRGENVC